MATRMLIDARHPEETRVAVLTGNRIEEFDFESAEHKQIKGNIYLAKVTRVEPSLQAAFVDFGGNRHGFLAFSEIHPDYYQIPKEDREALLAEEAAAAEEEAALRAADDADYDEAAEGHSDDYDGDVSYADEIDGDGVEEIDTSETDDVATFEGGQSENGDYDEDYGNADGSYEAAEDADDSRNAERGDERSDRGRGRGRRRQGQSQGQGQGQSQGRSRAKQADELRSKRLELRRRYKIQDVIQRRQVLLVQVVKEERGNKGAALTTYLSLAGRYCVLMPNSSHGGGISRKISNASDRKRLKQIMAELSLPKSMGCIVRTAGLSRTKPEIKRDFDYLARLWGEIRDRTLGSQAPAMIHSDSDLVKRAIRDIYNREIEEVVVEGEDGFKAARQFMKLLMPSHVRRVKPYSDPVPLFQRYGAEDQLSAMYDPVVQLKSGGYMVINPTEALVSIDINSGRSTKEHGIEQTALSTNLEAAREIGRQLRLRDMAGLVVIDFIDMEYSSNIRKVEKAMKDALKHDRARIQIGRISGFGLMEMSRQRLRTGVLEATTRGCPHCDGTGLVRTASSASLSALRLIEDEAAKGKGTVISLFASTEAAIYLLNAKRADLAEIEHRYGVAVEVVPEGEEEGAKMRVASSGPRPTSPPKFEPIINDDIDLDIPEEDEIDEEGAAEAEAEEDSDGRNRKRRRRRGGRDRDRDHAPKRGDHAESEGEEPSGEEAASDASESFEASNDESGEDQPKKRRRRGGRRRKRRGDEEAVSGEVSLEGDYSESGETLEIGPVASPDGEDAAEADEQPRKRRSRRKRAGAGEAAEAEAAVEPEAPLEAEALAEVEAVAAEAEEAEPAAKPKRSRRKKADADAEAPAEAAAEAVVEPATEAEPEAAPEAEEAPAKPKRSRKKAAAMDEAPAEAEAAAGEAYDGPPRRGWWQRTFGE